MQNESGSSFRSAPFLLKILIPVLVVVYIANTFTPLRLHVDTVRYYAIKDCIEFGCPEDSFAASDYLPYGYTALLIILSKLNLLSAFSVVLINILYLGASIFILYRLFQGYRHFWVFVALLLLQWTTIKFVAHPLSEMQYLLFSCGSLYFFNRFTAGKRFLHLGLAFLCGALAFLTRSVGVALAAALTLALLWQYRMALKTFIIKNKFVFGGILLVVLAVLLFSKQLGLNHYTGVLNKQFDEGMTIGAIFKAHFIEWAEIAFNVSIARLYAFVPSSLADGLFMFLGIAVFAFYMWLLLFRKLRVPFVVKAYLVLYSVLMFNWPFYDPRFWVPVVPFIIYTALQALPAEWNWRRVTVNVYFIVYGLVGAGAIGYFTYMGFNKEVFAQKQAAGSYRNEYEIYFYGKPSTDTARTYDPLALDILKKYDK